MEDADLPDLCPRCHEVVGRLLAEGRAELGSRKADAQRHSLDHRTVWSWSLTAITKSMLMDRLEPGGWIEVMPGFALTHVHNPGIAFSLFADGGPLTRVILHLVIFTSVVIIAAMLVRHAHNSRLAGVAFGLILGGARRAI